MNYNFSEAEKTIDEHWHKTNHFQVLKDVFRPKKLIIGFSNDNYFLVLTDVLARKYRMEGYNVFVSLPEYKAYNLGLSFDFEKIKIKYDYSNIFQKILKYVSDVSFFRDNLNIKEEFMEMLDEFKISSEKNFLLTKEKGYSLRLAFCDMFLGCEVFLTNCAYLFGAGFVKISANIKDLKDYCSEDEIDNIRIFLQKPNEEICFSGNYVYNPLTKQKMPVFIIKNQKEDFLLGIPQIIPEDNVLAIKNGLDFTKFIKNNLFINSDFVNGFDIEKANEMVFRRLSDIGIIEMVEKGKADNLFKNLLSINPEKVKKSLVLLIQVLKDLSYNIDLNLDETKNELDLWLKNSVILASKEEAEEVNYLLLTNIFLKKYCSIEKNIKELRLFERIDNKKNDSLSKDVLRLAILFDTDENDAFFQFIYDIYKLCFVNILSECAETEELIEFILSKSEEIYDKHNFQLFYDLIKSFLSVVLKNKTISRLQLIKFLKFIHPILPFISESIYTSVINGITLVYESFPSAK